MRYYSTKHPIETYPIEPFAEVKAIVHLYEHEYCDEIGMKAWGYIEYTHPLHPDIVEEYGFTIPAAKVKFLKYIGIDSWKRCVFEDENGKVWKYAVPGQAPQKRHDILYSSDKLDGEPGRPMPGEFDYRIIEEGGIYNE